MEYPTEQQVDVADRRQVLEWFRHLPTASNAHEVAIINKVYARAVEFGGFTPELSKEIGWDPR